MSEAEILTFDANGLLPAVIQHAETGAVLMVGFMNRESLERTRATGRVTFWSRSRKELWVKGETSGNFLNVVSVAKNCEANTLLIQAHPDGPTCHTGNDTCFYRPLDFETDLPDA